MHVVAGTNRVCVQVSEVYSLHRQTAYLAQDFFDRFMLTQEDVSKELLQLLGITALFIASKIEVGRPLMAALQCRYGCPETHNQTLSSGFFDQQEIYPPKIFEFAYVTDGACDTWDIQQTELLMLKVRTRWCRPATGPVQNLLGDH